MTSEKKNEFDAEYDNRVQKFDANGTFLTMWGNAGFGNGRFRNPYGVTADASASRTLSAYLVVGRSLDLRLEGTPVGTAPAHGTPRARQIAAASGCARSAGGAR